MKMEKKAADFWTVILQLVATQKLRLRVKRYASPEPLPWSNTMIEPVEGYIEPMSSGPMLKREVEWIEIDPRVKRKEGRLLPESVTDLSSEISDVFGRNGIPFEKVADVFRLVCPSESQ